jgi:very-short-patch-repair endonuclease
MSDLRNNESLHLGSKSINFQHANALRTNMTEAEIVLWNALRNRRLDGFKFRRQHPMKRFIADFYCHEAKLVLEIDGGIHDNISIQEHDDGRTQELADFDIKVIRFTNQEVINSLDTVLRRILIEIQQNLPENER